MIPRLGLSFLLLTSLLVVAVHSAAIFEKGHEAEEDTSLMLADDTEIYEPRKSKRPSGGVFSSKSKANTNQKTKVKTTTNTKSKRKARDKKANAAQPGKQKRQKKKKTKGNTEAKRKARKQKRKKNRKNKTKTEVKDKSKFKKMLESIKNAAKEVGKELLQELKDEAITFAKDFAKEWITDVVVSNFCECQDKACQCCSRIPVLGGGCLNAELTITEEDGEKDYTVDIVIKKDNQDNPEAEEELLSVAIVETPADEEPAREKKCMEVGVGFPQLCIQGDEVDVSEDGSEVDACFDMDFVNFSGTFCLNYSGQLMTIKKIVE